GWALGCALSLRETVNGAVERRRVDAPARVLAERGQRLDFELAVGHLAGPGVGGLDDAAAEVAEHVAPAPGLQGGIADHVAAGDRAVPVGVGLREQRLHVAGRGLALGAVARVALEHPPAEV